MDEEENVDEEDNKIGLTETVSGSNSYNINLKDNKVLDFLIVKKNKSGNELDVEIDGKVLFSKKFNCDILNVETSTKYSQNFNLTLSYTEISKCAEYCSQCFEYSDVITNPKINNQSGNKNHHRYHNEKRSTGKSHDGVDILAVAGTEVHSMLCGEVVHFRNDLPQDELNKGRNSKGYEASSYGITIIIKSKDNSGNIIYLYYAHLSKVNVIIGQKVKYGQVIGLSGSTGNAMAVDIVNRHVHMEAGTSYSTAGGNDGKLCAKLGGTMDAEKV
ncbi:M23 family metallopeptidase [Frigoriflavimonas asaccharolytica]|uniref:Murein DD-endopeptidase MepM/ murein hydrolase activator NlpD n=1 Tax=Frigoriflavimonas asaccharolytica TaxID=2735899 RepID=A0A8J8GDR4_9FLAO|nr:M23 family metallopeptidase [Frigoriflavimonas asaccharolytica]NRS94075.1 murein DD-endopeptidase MepM/ murein hydrolase activator NlpD [Frigoriflavimonas asaccharolytica]